MKERPFMLSSAMGALLGIGASFVMCLLGYLAGRSMMSEPFPFPQLLLMGGVGGAAGNSMVKVYYRCARRPRMGLGLAIAGGASAIVGCGWFLWVHWHWRAAASPPARFEVWVAALQTLGLGIGVFAAGFGVVLFWPDP